MSLFSFSPQAIPEAVRRIHEIIGPELFAVGGMIRDTVQLMIADNRTTAETAAHTDWDFATPLYPKEVLKRLRQAGIIAVPVGIEHGTVAAVIDRNQYEITTYRHDLEYTDGRHCLVRFADSIEEDLQRRDFTVNAMAMDLRTLQIYDPYCGIEDLRSRIIRTVGRPEDRFAEDHLRMVRAARFAAKLEAAIDEETMQAIRASVSKIHLVSAERIRDELMKMLTYPKPSIGFRILRHTGLLAEILPEFERCFGVEQNQYHSHDVGEHTLLVVDGIAPKYPFLRWIALMHDIAKPVCKQWLDERQDYVFYGHQDTGAELTDTIMKRLRFSNAEIARARHLVAQHMIDLHPEMNASTARRIGRRIGPEAIRDFLRLRMADRRGNHLKQGWIEPGVYYFVRLWRRIEREADALKIGDLKVDGRDLIRLGLPPGPLFREILTALLEKVLDRPELNQRQVLLTELRAYLDQQHVHYDIGILQRFIAESEH